MAALSTTGFDAVVLDAGGVLLMPDAEALRKHLAPFGICPSDEDCVRAHYAGMAEIDRLGVTDYGAADRAIARFLGVQEDCLDEAEASVSTVYRDEPYLAVPGAAEQLRRLQAAGLALAIVSNAGGTVEQQLGEHRICSVAGGPVADVTVADVVAADVAAAKVAIVVDSSVVGVEKPDPAIFSYALEALGLDAGRCLYVGDSVHFDVNGARAAGLSPVHLTPYPTCAGGDHPHVQALAELVDQLLG